MRVLFVIPGYEPAWAFGGTVTATVNLCRALVRQGVKVAVYTTDADGKGGHLDVPLNEPVDLGGVKVWYFKCDFGVRRAFYSRGLAKKLKETVREFDIVDVSAIWQWIQVDVVRICRRNGIPFIVTPHNSLSLSSMRLNNNFKKRFYWRLWGKNTIKMATAIRFLCEGERRNSVNNIFSLPSFIVPNGIDISFFTGDRNKALRKKIGFREDDIVLLYVGRVHPDKRIDFFLRELSNVSKNRIKMLIIGSFVDKDYRFFLKQLIKKFGLKEKVVLKGLVEHNKIRDFYLVADLLVLVSRFEGVSMTSIEALSAGLPIILSKGVANFNEIVEDGAGILLNDQPDDFARILHEISLSKINLKKLSRNARKSAEKRYDINKVAEMMIKAYEDVLTGRRSPELRWM